MARPKPDEELIMVVIKIPKSIWEQLRIEGKKSISPDTGLSYKSVPLFCKKLIFESLRKLQQKKS